MRLCFDAGNSRLKWGLHDGATWLGQGACDYASLDALALPGRPTRAVACNVAGPHAAAALENWAARASIPLAWFRGDTPVAGLHNGYDTPSRLGADRWAALAGARHLHAGPAVVVMAGTATTVDALDAQGRFLGGLILPGLELMRRSLAQNTADLPVAQGAHTAFPTHTDAAIVSGAIEATAGAIERMAHRLKGRASCGATPAASADLDVCCLLSGGAAEMLAPHLGLPLKRVDYLVLEGLARVIPGDDLL